jgi:hypothetical protein
MREVMTSTGVTKAPHRGRRRVALAAAALLVVLALVGWVVVGHRPAAQERGADANDAADSRATIHDVSFNPSDTAYVVESVDAVVQGGQGFLRLRIRWVDDPEDASSGQAVAALSATVTHAEPYAGLTATCGTDAAVERGPEEVTMELRLPCQGLLVPEDVATVELRD